MSISIFESMSGNLDGFVGGGEEGRFDDGRGAFGAAVGAEGLDFGFTEDSAEGGDTAVLDI